MADVRRFLDNLETYDRLYGDGGRRRKRRAADRRIFEQQVEALVCDLAVQHLRAPGSWLRVPRSKATLGKRDRYKPPWVTEKLVGVMDMLARPEVSFCEVELGRRAPEGCRGSRRESGRGGASSNKSSRVS